MQWFLFFEMILELIAECLERRGEQAVKASLGNPGRVEKLVLRRALRRSTGLKGRELRNEVDATFAELLDMNASEIDDLVSGASYSAR